MEFEKDICGDPRIQPGSLVSPSRMSKDISLGQVRGNLSCPFAHIILLKTKKMVHRNTRISCRIITCMVVALPLPNHRHFWGSISINIICIQEGLLIFTRLYLPSQPCTLFGLLYFHLVVVFVTDIWCRDGTQGLVCATAIRLCHQVRAGIIVRDSNPAAYYFRNLHNVMAWVLIRVKIKVLRSICMTPMVANMHSNTCTISHAS